MKFVQYDINTGVILASGEMPEASIDHLVSLGQGFVKTGEVVYPLKGYKVNLDTKEVYMVIESQTEIQEQAQAEEVLLSIGLKNAILVELQRTDYTQALDAVEHMSQQDIDSYRVYRQLLRIALTKPTAQEMMAALPVLDPSGVPRFERYAYLLVPKPEVSNNVTITITNVYSNTA